MLERSDLYDVGAWLLAGLGAIVASAVFLSCMFAAGLVYRDAMLIACTGTAAGFTYLGYLLQTLLRGMPRFLWPLMLLCVVISNLAGVLAGLRLLFIL